MSLEQLERIIAPLVAAPQRAFKLENVRKYWYVESDDIPAPLQMQVETIGGIKAEWLRRPGTRTDRAILYLHGGGYVCGSIRTHRTLTNDLARTFDGAIVTIDYRLAPEAPYPAAIDDAVAAYKHLLARGIPPSGIAIAGDSAGGGLTVATALRLRDLNLPLPGALWAISPWADMTGTSASINGLGDRDPIVFKDSLVNCAKLYLGGKPERDPLASPVFADLKGLPPLLIHIGAREILLDDALGLARAAGAANVEVTCEVWPGMVHVWHMFAPQLDEATDANQRGIGWIEQRLTC